MFDNFNNDDISDINKRMQARQGKDEFFEYAEFVKDGIVILEEGKQGNIFTIDSFSPLLIREKMASVLGNISMADHNKKEKWEDLLYGLAKILFYVERQRRKQENLLANEIDLIDRNLAKACDTMLKNFKKRIEYAGTYHLKWKDIKSLLDNMRECQKKSFFFWADETLQFTTIRIAHNLLDEAKAIALRNGIIIEGYSIEYNVFLDEWIASLN